jgi:hypothetical protein
MYTYKGTQHMSLESYENIRIRQIWNSLMKSRHGEAVQEQAFSYTIEQQVSVKYFLRIFDNFFHISYVYNVWPYNHD